jgi:hypothetical protein
MALLLGCTPTLKYGSPPRTERLESLKTGSSTEMEVRHALGEPRGGGALRWSDYPGPWEIWFYEYLQVEGGLADLKMLLVFFKDQKYDGHLWFSSLHEVPK